MDLENDLNHFHDSDAGDIYDLYNACNGVLHNGLLDVRKLDELSQAELEAFDLPRLRDLWSHTASGCSQCAGIITVLNEVRGTLNEHSEEQVELDFTEPSYI